MPITTIYRVSLTLPDVLAAEIGASLDQQRAFENDMGQATSGNDRAGSNRYSDWEEWAEFHSERDAHRAEALMHRVVHDKWMKKINGS